MCGIAGILRVHPPGAPPPPPAVAIPEEWLDILDESIKHRGPDGQGRFRDRAVRPDGTVVDVALVHRRLAIIDPACGQQPMVWSRSRGLWSHEAVNARARAIGEDGPAELASYQDDLVAVVFNGCIYNHRELRKELQAAGHQFETDHSDTEVLVQQWRRSKEDMFSRVVGMFALAIWDRSQVSLTLARDQFGEKPLVYTSHGTPGGGYLNVFASGLPGPARVAAEAGLTEGLRTHQIDEWLRFGFGLTPPISCASPITKGAVATLMNGSWRVRPFGSFVADQPELIHARTEPLPIELADTLIRRAVEARLEADVPLGCFLSGGVDSSLVALHARRALGRLDSFTVRMPDPAFDESEFAVAAANAIGCEQHTLDCHPDPANDVVALIHTLGLPFGDSSLLPAHWVSNAARQMVRVALSGDGGDELFVGYERYWAADQLLRRSLFAWFPARLLRSGGPKSWSSKVSRLVNAARGMGYLDLISIFPTSDLRRLLARSETTELPNHARAGGNMAVAWDVAHYLPDDLLRKTDTASMQHALEVRCPFLDPQLAVACLSAKLTDLIPRGQRKGLLRQVARKYLPAEIVDRPKQGFAIPIGDWFRSDYGGLRTLLLDHLNSAEPWGPPSLGIELNMKFVRQMLDEHLGTGPSGLVRRDHSQRLYMLLVLSIWAKWLGSL